MTNVKLMDQCINDEMVNVESTPQLPILRGCEGDQHYDQELKRSDRRIVATVLLLEVVGVVR